MSGLNPSVFWSGPQYVRCSVHNSIIWSFWSAPALKCVRSLFHQARSHPGTKVVIQILICNSFGFVPSKGPVLPPGRDFIYRNRHSAEMSGAAQNLKYDWLMCKINHQHFSGLSLCRSDSCPWTCYEMRFHASVSEEVMKQWLFLWSHMLLLPNEPTSCAVSDLLIRLSQACSLGLEWFSYLNTSWKGQSPAFPVNDLIFIVAESGVGLL